MSEKKQAPDKATSRRDFLRSSSAAVAGGAILGAIAPRAFAVGSDEIRVGLVGCGGRGTGAASQALHTSGPVKLVAMADAFEDRLNGSLRNLQRDQPIAPRLDVPAESQYVGPTGFQKIMERDDIHVVILTTPPGLRPAMFEAAVKAGKHVFMEKPVASDAPGVRQVLAANEIAKQKNLKVGVGLQRHHQKPYIESVKALQDGAIGDFTTFRVYWNGGGVWVRTREELLRNKIAKVTGQKIPDDREAARALLEKHRGLVTEMEYQVMNWYYFNWLCGDHITEQHIHNLDVANWVKGGHPTEAQGQGGREVRTSDETGQIYDHHFVEFTYADGTKMFSQCRHIPGCWNHVDEYVEGTKGRSHIGRWIEPTGGERQRFGGGQNPYQVEHDRLFEAIRKDTPFNEAEYGAHSTMTSILGRMATYSGKEVKWDEALAKGKELVPPPSQWGFDKTPPVTPENGKYPVAVPGKYNPFA